MIINLPVTDEQPSTIIDPVLVQLLQFLEHGLRVDHYAVAEDVFALWVQDAAWLEVECVFCFVDDDRVSGIGTTVESAADVEVLGKDVHKLAFTLIAPLGAEDDAEFGVEAVDALALSSS